MRSAEQEAWDDGVNPVDLPYGPGNPDYENDGRQDEPHPEDLRLKQYFEFARSLFDSSH